MNLHEIGQNAILLARIDALERQVADLTRRLDEWTAIARKSESVTIPAKTGTLSLKRGQ